MAEEEAEKEHNRREKIVSLRKRFQDLTTIVKQSSESAVDATTSFCHEFCQALVEHGGQWKQDEDPLPLLEMYTVAILCYAEATPCLSPDCGHVSVVLEKLALTCLDLVLLLSEKVPGALWEEFQSSVKTAHGILQGNGNSQLHSLSTLAEETGAWTNATLCSLLSGAKPDAERVHELLTREGPVLLEMRIKHLIKQKFVEKAAILAKACAEYPEFEGKKNFKQIYLVCLCETKSQEGLMEEIAEIDCKDTLEMICNLESDGDEKGALSLCTAFLKRQLVQGDVYCAWELTLFWSKLLIRLESVQAFLDQCRLLARLSGSVYHILLLIKVIQEEVEDEGLPVCIEMCIRALQMGVSGSEDCGSTICKTISCLLPSDLEVKRACQLTEFLVKPTIDSYYAVETLFNEPDQKLEEESLPIPNSLRCDLLLALKTLWPFDPEFWDWKTLKRHCLSLMGEEASIVSSIDKLNDSEDNDNLADHEKDYKDLDFILNPTTDLHDIEAERQKKREMKKMREKGFVSARFRNWQAYMQYCVLCDREFLGHRIVKHALKHVQDGIFRCPICAKPFETRAVLEPHVASHVKQSSKERLAAMKASEKRPSPSKTTQMECTNEMQLHLQHNTTHVKVKSETKTKKCVSPSDSKSGTTAVAPLSPQKSGQPVREIENTEDCSCPVSSCQKVFKYFRNLVSHVKAHKNDDEAKRFLEIQCQKVVCQYCRRQFVNVTHLNDHLQMHCGDKPYFCIQLGCKTSFQSHAELLMHKRVHSEFQAQCMFPNCGKIFSEAYLLYDHEAQHYIMFTCKTNDCGKIFYSQSQLSFHQKEHLKQEGPGMLEKETPPTEPPPQSSHVHEQSSNPKAPEELSPMKIKHSVESMLNSTQDPSEEAADAEPRQTNETPSDDMSSAEALVFESVGGASKPSLPCQTNGKSPPEFPITPCYVKVQPIVINCHDPVYLNAARGSDSMAQTLIQDRKLYFLNQAKENNAEPGGTITEDQCAQTVEKPITNHAIVRTNLQCSPQSSPATAEGAMSHQCPFEKCTRGYNTSKSLSRHVKNVHSSAYEEWKLSKKYKRIADIAARKVPSVHRTTDFQTPKKERNTPELGALQQNPEIRQLDYQMGSAMSSPHADSTISHHPFSAKFGTLVENCQGETLSDHIGVMQSEICQQWHSSASSDYNSEFSQQNHFPSMILPDQLQAYQSYQFENKDSTAGFMSQNDMEYALIPNDNSILPAVNPDLGVLNEASKYVSSSLRVLHALNGEQSCEISQEVASDHVGFAEIRQNQANGVPPNDSLLPLPEPGLNSYYPGLSTEPLPSLAPPLAVQEKSFTTGHANDKNINHLTYPHCKEEPESYSVSHVSNAEEVPKTKVHEDLSYNGTFQAETQTTPVKDESIKSSDETKKVKKARSSKRTKWPAIIKDGKVICCRCYREFSSTKSLGGHLSKRSQCKPVDEVDLTADLPVSFLDFLNEPDFSNVHHQPTTRTYDHGQDRETLLHQSPESNSFPKHSYTELCSPSFNSESGELSNTAQFETTNSASQTNEESVSFKDSPSAHHPPGDDMNSKKSPLMGKQSQTQSVSEDNETSGPSGEDGNILEIQKALQRLDLVDGLTSETPKVPKPNVHNVSPVPVSGKDVSRGTNDDGVTEEQQNVLKPFKCDAEGCAYGAMTKEALFKHLFRIHNYSNDMINELKKHSDRFAPYSCRLCAKTFTRTTGLRIHYQNVHHLSKEQLVRLKKVWHGKSLKNSSSDVEELNCGAVNSQRKHPLPVQHSSLNSVSATPGVSTEINGGPVELATGGNECLQQAPETLKETQMANASQRGADDSPSSKVKSDQSNEGQSTPSNSYHCYIPDMQNGCKVDPAKQLAGSLSPSGAISFGPDKNEPTKAAVLQAEKRFPEKKDNAKKTNTTKGADLQTREKPQMKSSDPSDKNDGLSLYRPFRCVHEGCVAAFSIQQNLILHYRAMHQSDQDTEVGIQREANGVVQDFKCQVKDCSKVLFNVTSLLKHYILLHRCTLDKASALLAGIEVGTFQCDQSKCPASFTSYLAYLDHIKDDHKAIRISVDGEFESVDLTFKCEWEGCDRIYTTKSNLLRHFMKKHQGTPEDYEKNDGNDLILKVAGVKSNNGKENMANNKFKMKRKKKEDKAENHWTSFAKPSLKSKDEASAMCTKKFPLQYPCMIKGCESVLSAERNIFKHYTTHGLTERYIEDQRSQFIFCKKYSRSRNKSEGTSAETSEGEERDSEESDDSSLIMDPELSDVSPPESKVLAEETSMSLPTPVVKRKRGRPPKSSRKAQINCERKQSLRNSIVDIDNHEVNVSGSSTMNTNYLKDERAERSEEIRVLNPEELDTSFLKLLEGSSSSANISTRKTNDIDLTEVPSKRQRTLYQQMADSLINVSGDFKDTKQDQNVINFKNPLNLESVKNVKIVLDKNFSSGADLLLKQLQDMCPMVIVQKWFS